MKKALLGLMLLSALFAFAKTPHAPLPAALLEAKTVYIDNQSGTASFSDRCYDELSKWGRFKVISEPANADIILRISSSVHSSGMTANTRTTNTGPYASSQTDVSENKYGVTRIDIIKSGTEQVLWSDSRRWGIVHSATREVIKELRKRMEEQERK